MKKVIITTAFLLTIVVANAQLESDPARIKHEYSIYFTGGKSNLLYNQNPSKAVGNTKKGFESFDNFGKGIGLGYTHNFSHKFGISTGAEVSTYDGEVYYPTIGEEYTAPDNRVNGYLAKYTYSIKNYRETQDLLLLSIPLMAQFKTPIARSMHFYAAGGFKIGFPLTSKAKLKADEIVSSGYFNYEMVTYNGMPENGFFTEHSPNERVDKIITGFPAILSLESGLRFTLDKKSGIALYAGFYFDYCLNDIKDVKNMHLLNYSDKLSYGSIMNTDLIEDKMSLMSVGLKIKLAINPKNKVVGRR